MDNLELVSFQIISAVGVAKSFYIEAMKIAEKGDFDLAKAKIKEGDQEFVKGHEAHAGLIQKEANGEKVVPNILLMHAEDQLMSTSMLASNMQSVANAHNLPIKVAAFSHNKLEEIIEKDTPDCILLGPQVKYMYEETVEQFGNTGIPIAVIDQADYGMMNGEKVLKSAIKLIKSNKK